MIQIDGSYGEGGGQILRTSCSLAALTGQEIEINGIRAGRSKPGLQPQHLAAIRAAGELCGAEMRGDAVGSMFLSFKPTRTPEAGNYRFDIGTAGSTCLVFQTVLPILLKATGESMVEICGGTHNPMAPTFDYVNEIFLAAWAGDRVCVECGPFGFFPRGGGRLSARIQGGDRWNPIDIPEIDKQAPLRCTIASSLGRPELFSRARKELASRHGSPVAGPDNELEGPSEGIAILLRSGLAGFTALGARGKTMEQVAGEAYAQYDLWKLGKPGLEEHLADQLVMPALLAEGVSRWCTSTVSEHLLTVLQVIEWFGVGETSISDGVVSLRAG